MLVRLFMLKIILVYCVLCHSSVIIKTGTIKSQEEQKHHDGNNQDVSVKLGTSGFNSENGYDKDNENKHTQAEDAGKYLEENTDKKNYLDQGKFSNDNFHQEGGGSVADFGNKLAHNKGHHKSGFHNSYHKDESGSNSSYYDDSDNEGGEYVHHSRKGTFGDTGLRSSQGSHLDGNYHLKEGNKHGGYNNGGSYNRDVGNNRNYNQQNYHDNHENQGKAKSGNHFGSSQEYFKEHRHHRPWHYDQPPYYSHPHYYEKPRYYEEPYYENYDYVNNYDDALPYKNYDYPEKKTITIYEDPRIYEQNSQYRTYEKPPPYQTNYDSDLIQLDVRPPLPLKSLDDYQVKPANVDYYY